MTIENRPVEIKCPACKGLGGTFDNLGNPDKKCETCDGSRFVTRTVPVDVTPRTDEHKAKVAALEQQRRSDADAYTEALRAMAEKCQRFDKVAPDVARLIKIAGELWGYASSDDLKAIERVRLAFLVDAGQ